jgi:TolA-binding protein
MARGISRVRRAMDAADRAASAARREGTRPGSGRGNRGDTPEIAERDRQAAAERARTRANQEQARATERRGSISRSPVSAEDIRQANTAAQFRDMQRRIDELPEGLRRTTMQRMLDRQKADLDATRAAEADRASRRSSQANRDRTVNTKENVTLPSMPFAKGGMTKKKFNKGGYANAGASVKPDGKRRK